MAIVDHLGTTVHDLARSTAQFDAVLGTLGFVRTDAEGSVAWWVEGEPEIILFPSREPGDGPHVHGRVGWQVVREPKPYPRFNERYYASFVEDASGIRLEFMFTPPTGE